MDKLLKYFVSNFRSVNSTQDSSNWLRPFMPLQTTNYPRLGRNHPYSRPEASWREMLLDQPPTPSIAVRDDLMPLRPFGVLCEERKSVLRLKHLETLVQVGRYEVLGWESSGGMQILASALYYGKSSQNSRGCIKPRGQQEDARVVFKEQEAK
ncbi:hypothetical protein RIB2604_01900720 [Aspergillus luchuensis]|uniref:Uncharacterized protein n=1 Tax=Aspergillus kawachii TaxID=1069201 RepID=A0A146FGH9_ASPKA|nr:hypothetical protein RIB2604_01900720 [Aspergillus luchuensis]